MVTKLWNISNRISLLSVLLLVPILVSAHLHGIVVDEKGEPLIGANVFWAGSSTGTATDVEGNFEIELIRQTKLLVTTYLGYRNDTTLVKDRSALFITMYPDDATLEEITIQARQLGIVRSRLTTFDVQNISGNELCKAACCNLSESFETSASVDVAYSDAATGAKQIRLLGLSGTYVQLLGENCPAVRGLAQNFGMEYIPGSWMESIQVSKGTSSVINGYEAITGQINVEYLKPQTQSPIAVNAMLNKELQAEVNLTGGWDIPIPNDPLLGTLATGVLAHYQNGSWRMDDNKDGFLDMPKNQNINVLNRWWYKSDQYGFQFLVRGLHDERRGGQREASVHSLPMPENPYLIDLTTNRIDGFMKHGFILDDKSNMSIGLITAASYHKQKNNYGQRLWDASQTNAYMNLIFQGTWEGGDILGGGVDNDHKLSAGISVNYDKYNEQIGGLEAMYDPAKASTDMLDLSRQEVTPGVFAEYTYKIEDRFSMVAGLRGDWSNKYGFFFTPRLNVRYAPFEWWTMRASVGLGYRSPNVIADNAQFLPSNRLWTSTMLQNPEQERALNTGASMSFDIPLGSKNLQLSVDYYYAKFMQGVLSDMDSARQKVCFYNMSEIDGAQSFSHTAQVEATMEILRGWTMTAAFRYSDVKQTSYNQALGRYELREKALTSRYKGIITTSYLTPLHKWQFDFTTQFNGPGRMPDGSKTAYHPWYPQLMAQITKFFKHNLSVYVGAENMTNFKQEDPIIGQRDAQGLVMPTSPDFDASMVWGPTTGWKIYAGLRWSLDNK